MSDATISTVDYQRAVAEATRRKEKIRALEADTQAKADRIKELESLLNKAGSSINTLTAELDGLKARPADEKDKRIAELEREIKTRDLRGEFDKLAKGKVREDALDAAWRLSGLTPDVELAENGLAEAVDALVKGHAFLAPEPPKPEPAATGSRGPDASGKPTVQPTGQPAPGAARGTVNQSTAPASADAGRNAAEAYASKTGRGGNPYRVA